MRLWKAALLMNLALAVGVGWGYLFWGREAARLERELAAAQSSALVVGVEREWTITGVVRAILPEIGVIVITHDEIPGLMAPMTMGFRAASPRVWEGIRIGDAVRFTLRGVPPNVNVTAMEKTS